MRAAPIDSPAARTSNEPAEASEHPGGYMVRHGSARHRLEFGIAAHTTRKRLNSPAERERLDDFLHLAIRVC